MQLISIIIPVYNDKSNLKRCLDSALNQKYPDTEIIIVSDGAPPDIYEILNDYSERYTSIIKLISRPHLGVLQARLTGLEAASGEYVIFLDSDDYINRIYLYELMYVKRYSDCDIVLAKTNYVKNELVTSASRVYPREFRISEDKKTLLSIDSSVNGKLFQKDSLKLPDYRLQANEALPYLYYYLVSVDKISFSNFSKYYVSSGKNTVSKNYLDGNLLFIDNVIRPLEIMYNLYKGEKLLSKYQEEVEAIFIKNIFLEIDRVKRVVKDREKQPQLINVLIKYLNYHFPKWRENKYLKRGFVDFNSDIFVKLNMVALGTRRIKTTGTLDSNEATRGFKRILKN